MNTNCLVTNLKAVVNNDNLDYLNKIVITFGLPQGFTTGDLCAFGSKITISDVSLVNPSDGALRMHSNYLAFTTSQTLSSVSIFLNKYKDNAFISGPSTISLDLHQIVKYYTMTELVIDGNSITNISLEELLKAPNLKNIYFRNVPNLTGDISVLADRDCTKLRFYYIPGITGDLSSIKDIPSLTTVILDHTYITDNYDTVTYLRNRGVTVTYVPYE
jgi:hypothetical protein